MPRARENAAPSPIVGSWVGAAPVVYRGADVRTETRDSRVEYRADGSFRYAARMTVFGDRLPRRGLAFAIEGSGRWQLSDGELVERFTAAQVSPVDDASPSLELVAQAMSDEATARPPTRSAVLETGPERLVLRDLESGDTVTYVREMRSSRQ